MLAVFAILKEFLNLVFVDLAVANAGQGEYRYTDSQKYFFGHEKHQSIEKNQVVVG